MWCFLFYIEAQTVSLQISIEIPPVFFILTAKMCIHYTLLSHGRLCELCQLYNTLFAFLEAVDQNPFFCDFLKIS